MPILERLDLYSAARGTGSDVLSIKLFRASGPPAAPARDVAALVPRMAWVGYDRPVFRYEQSLRMRL